MIRSILEGHGSVGERFEEVENAAGLAFIIGFKLADIVNVRTPENYQTRGTASNPCWADVSLGRHLTHARGNHETGEKHARRE